MNTVVPSPKALLAEFFAARRGVSLEGARAFGDSVAMVGLPCGTKVCRIDDPRHVGRVEAINGVAVTVRWANGWKETIDDHRDLMKIKGE